MRVVEQVFELILRLYPSDFRRHYGDEMRGFVRARLGEPRYASPWGAGPLRRRPAFTIVAAVTMALGIGAASAIFGVIDTMLFRPLRYLPRSRSSS